MRQAAVLGTGPCTQAHTQARPRSPTPAALPAQICVERSAVFRILTESKADGAPLTLEALCAADDIIQEVKSLNTELVQL